METFGFQSFANKRRNLIALYQFRPGEIQRYFMPAIRQSRILHNFFVQWGALLNGKKEAGSFFLSYECSTFDL